MTEQEKREKVISELEACVDDSIVAVVPCNTVLDALELLKAQEPVKPVYNGDCDWEECSNCGYVLSKQYNPCPGCGRPVKWE